MHPRAHAMHVVDRQGSSWAYGQLDEEAEYHPPAAPHSSCHPSEQPLPDYPPRHAAPYPQQQQPPPPSPSLLPPLPIELAPPRERAKQQQQQPARERASPVARSSSSAKGHTSIELPFTSPPCRITLDHSGQHTLEWSSAISYGGLHLDPGSCLLYTYPSGYSGDRLELLDRIVVYLATTYLFERPDAVGAFPIHAILVCNTPESLRASFACLEANPRLLLQVHEYSGPFAGETALHIMCANRREDEACRMIDLALAFLDETEVAFLLRNQASGAFFEDPPMRWYGETPLGYACVFGTKRAARKMLDTGLVRFDDNAGALCGFFPVHAVVANGNQAMYDWMTKELPVELRADGSLRSRSGRLASLNLDGMSGMQLACKMGLRFMFQHIMRREHVKVLWKWGPVAAYELALEGIDSSGDGAADVMEIVARQDASHVTTTFILDDFMQVRGGGREGGKGEREGGVGGRGDGGSIVWRVRG